MQAPGRTLRARLALPLLAGLLLGLVVRCGRPEELWCEEAIAHLEHCCAGLPGGQLSCAQYTDGCAHHDPDLTEGDSRCIAARSCTELVGSDVCGRVQRFAASPHYEPATGVCP
jgi:hypothetical protein